MKMRKTVSILTANSQTGKACLERILLRHDNCIGGITAAFRSADKAEATLDLMKDQISSSSIEVRSVTGIEADDPASLVPALENSDYAMIVTPHDVSKGIKRDSEFSNNMIKVCAESNVKHIVYVGSWTVLYPDSMSLLASRFIPTEEYLRNDELIKDSGMGWTVLRCGYFNSNFIASLGPSIKRNSKFVLPENFSLAPCDPMDIGVTAADILASKDISQHNGQYYGISGPQRLELEDFERIFSEKLGRKVTGSSQPLSAFARMHPPIYQLMEHITTNGKDALPLSEDVKKITGNHSSFENWLDRNLHHFQ